MEIKNVNIKNPPREDGPHGLQQDGHSEPPTGPMLRRPKDINYILLCLSFCFLGIIVILVAYLIILDNITRSILITIGNGFIVTGLITGGFNEFIRRIYKDVDKIFQEELFTTLKKMRETFSEQTIDIMKELTSQTENIRDDVTSHVLSLHALQVAGGVRIYENRSEATDAIKATLEDKKVDEIKIIGISLNDFIRDENKSLHAAWETIEKYIRGKEIPTVDKLDIKLLIIDPCCYGAYLRAKAEGEEDYVSTRLFEDVVSSMRHFHKLQLLSTQGRVSFEVRIYRTAPILYMVWTPKVSFVGQYYFRPSHKAGINIPLIKYHEKSGTPDKEITIHNELKFHFDWIWKRDAITLDDFFNKHCVGIDASGRNANIENIYYNPSCAGKRILHLIESTKNILWVKGITLNSFFKYGSIFEKISNKCFERKGNIDFRILLINPDGEQAKIRSFKEYLIDNPGSKIELFTEAIRKQQRLYTDINVSILNIKALLKDLQTAGIFFKQKHPVKYFDSSPESFMLVTDHSILVEQYHYGKIGPSKQGKKILVGDIPLIEYRRVVREDEEDKYIIDGISRILRDELEKNPYEIFKDHFEYAFDYFSSPLE